MLWFICVNCLKSFKKKKKNSQFSEGFFLYVIPTVTPVLLWKHPRIYNFRELSNSLIMKLYLTNIYIYIVNEICFKQLNCVNVFYVKDEVASCIDAILICDALCERIEQIRTVKVKQILPIINMLIQF